MKMKYPAYCTICDTMAKKKSELCEHLKDKWSINMGSITAHLTKLRLIDPPGFVIPGLQYETIMGSESYGVSSNDSDRDIYGFTIPPKDIIFPHLRGEIEGFGRQKTKRFNQFEKDHVLDKSARGGHGCTYDLDIYSIIKYFQLCMENNPNMLDSLFTPERCILFMTPVGKMVRDARKIFLHKGAWHKFKGYSYSQLHKMKIKNPEGKRKEMVDKYGYDLKFAYHIVRLLGEIEQILIEGDLDLERNREQLKSIRRGDWKMEDIEKYFETKEQQLEELYIKSDLQHSPDEVPIKQLLLDCLEMQYGSLSDCLVKPDQAIQALRDIDIILQKNKSLIEE